MQTSFAIIAVFAAHIYRAAGATIATQGTPTSCGQNTCCIPSCLLQWSDGNGCVDAQARTASACSNAFFAADTTMDTGVDICDGAGAFFCGTDGGAKAVFVVNRSDAVSVALFPASYDECTLSGQCAGCPQQLSCQDPVSIGTSVPHNCDAFNDLLASSGVNLPPC